MQTLTFSVNVPDELVHRFRTLPDVERRAFLETMDAFAVATLAAKESDAATAAAYYLPDPSEGLPSTEADARAVQEAFDDFDAGDRGKSPAESFARLAAKYHFKNPVL